MRTDVVQPTGCPALRRFHAGCLAPLIALIFRHGVDGAGTLLGHAPKLGGLACVPDQPDWLSPHPLVRYRQQNLSDLRTALSLLHSYSSRRCTPLSDLYPLQI